ncbi:hypothetical protein D3C85_1258790 [compost metagenome]
MDREQHAGGRGHALATREAVEHREQVAQEHAQRRQRHARVLQPVARAEVPGQPDREPALQAIANQRQDGRLLVARAQHVGGAGVARAVAVRVRQTHELADHDGKGHRPDQVGDDGE